ncbi:MAG: hypothetical protein ACI9VR_004616, partial [Cognaticolwellia sp.]
MPYAASLPALDGSEVAARAQTILDVGLPTAAPVTQSWIDLVDRYGDEQCPDREAYSMLDAPFGCQSSTGAYFSGMTALKQESNSIELLCDAYVLTPDGERFECGGEAIQLVDPSGKGRWTMLLGTFGWEAQPFETGGIH